MKFCLVLYCLYKHGSFQNDTSNAKAPSHSSDASPRKGLKRHPFNAAENSAALKDIA